jgi:hypothetical protein
MKKRSISDSSAGRQGDESPAARRADPAGEHAEASSKSPYGLSYDELRRISEEVPWVKAYIETMTEFFAKNLLPADGDGFRLKLRERPKPALTDDQLRERVAAAIRMNREVAPPRDEECECPPGVPVLATNPEHCPACGGHRPDWRDECTL